MINFVVENGSGLSTATSYVSVEEANDIASTNIHTSTDWLALSLDAKQNLLIYCSRVLDSRATWGGYRLTTGQGLEWPRSEVVDRYDNAVASNVVPYNVRWATVEFAKFTTTTDKLAVSTPESVLSEVKIDTIALKFADPTAIALDQYATPNIVVDLLRGLGTLRRTSKKVTFGKVYRV